MGGLPAQLACTAASLAPRVFIPCSDMPTMVAVLRCCTSLVGLFFTDMLKGMLLALVFMPPLVGVFTYILQRAGPWVPLQLWAFVLVVSLFFMTIYPVAIAPLFNKYENLPEGSLRTKIEELAGSLSFPLKKLYSMDGSKRSAHSNAYM